MSATKLLNDLFNAGVSVSIIATVLSLGMTFTIPQLLAPLRRVWVVIVVAVLNVLVIPAAAWGLFKVFGLSNDAVSGLTLAAVGAGGPGGLKAAQLAKRADMPFTVAIVVILQLLNLIAVPLWAGHVVKGATISGGTILKDLLLLVLLPLAIGLLVKARYDDHAKDWSPALVKIANAALLIALTAGIAVNWSAIVSLLGSRVLIAALVVVVVSLALGFVAGWTNSATRTASGLVTGLRFSSLGLIIIGTQLGGKSAILGPAIVFSLLDFIGCVIVGIEIGKRMKKGPASKPAPPASEPTGTPSRA